MILKPFDERIKESKNIMEKYPDRLPFIVQRYKNCKNIKDINKNKFLVPKDMSMSQFVYIIRKRIELSPEQALFVLVNGNLIPSKHIMSNIYENGKDKDGFLYMYYSSENTFG
jgi:GABA(A) receptor-associated protein